jgi:hypothetical protein
VDLHQVQFLKNKQNLTVSGQPYERNLEDAWKMLRLPAGWYRPKAMKYDAGQQPLITKSNRFWPTANSNLHKETMNVHCFD